MSDHENSPLQSIWDAMSLTVDLSGLLTDAQNLAIAYGLAALIGSPPDAFFGIKHNPCAEGEVRYTFYWVKGGAFGQAEVLQPDSGSSAAPTMSAWVRPLADVRKVDVGFDVTNPMVVRTEYTVKLKITAHWDDQAVVLDATGSMSNHARPELEKLIDVVLKRAC